jgi:hypothetical protein
METKVNGNDLLDRAELLLSIDPSDLRAHELRFTAIRRIENEKLAFLRKQLFNL